MTQIRHFDVIADNLLEQLTHVEDVHRREWMEGWLRNFSEMEQQAAQAAPPQETHFEPLLEDLTHTRSCPSLTPGHEESCTCGLKWRIRLRTEMEMRNAWEKRAYQAERELAASPVFPAQHAPEELEAQVGKLLAEGAGTAKFMALIRQRERAKEQKIFELQQSCDRDVEILDRAARRIEKLQTERTPLREALKKMAKRWRAERAHTYSSENADHYRGFDAGRLRSAEELEAALRAALAPPAQSGKESGHED